MALPSESLPPGWQRAGFTGPDCVKFGPPRRSGQLNGRDAGWSDAGFVSPECERFVPVSPA